MQAFQLRIDIKGTKPPVWRRVRVPVNTTFAQLHRIIQELFGWDDYHLYDFKLKDCVITAIMDEDYYGFYEQEKLEAENVCLIEKLREGMKFTYTYDFGDNWDHSIKVEKIVEQEEAYPILLKWAQDNLCEDIGGVYGYYTKMECMKDSTNPEAQELREWFEDAHNPFDAHYVQECLCAMSICEESGDLSLQEFYDDLEYILMGVEEDQDALIKIDTEDETLYVRAHAGDSEYIQIFASKEDCAFALLHQTDPAQAEPMYVEGICIDFPDEEEMDEIMDTQEIWQPTIYYHECGRGMRETTDEEFSRICLFLDITEGLRVRFSQGDMLPDFVTEKKMLEITANGDMCELQLVDLDLEDPLVEITCTDEELATLTKSKKTKDKLNLMIAPIENLLDEQDMRDVVYYLLMHGEKEHEYQYLEHLDYVHMGNIVKDILVKYIQMHGRPKTIYCEDGHITDMLKSICRTLKINLRQQKQDKKMFVEEYFQAFEEQNPIHLLDKDFVKSILDHGQEFIQDIVHGSDDALRRKLERYMTFIEMVMM